MTDHVAEFMASAQNSPIELTVAELLAIFGFRARTNTSVPAIYRALSSAGLACEPDFREGPRESVVRIGAPRLATR